MLTGVPTFQCLPTAGESNLIKPIVKCEHLHQYAVNVALGKKNAAFKITKLTVVIGNLSRLWLPILPGPLVLI